MHVCFSRVCQVSHPLHFTHFDSWYVQLYDSKDERDCVWILSCTPSQYCAHLSCILDVFTPHRRKGSCWRRPVRFSFVRRKRAGVTLPFSSFLLSTWFLRCLIQDIIMDTISGRFWFVFQVLHRPKLEGRIRSGIQSRQSWSETFELAVLGRTRVPQSGLTKF